MTRAVFLDRDGVLNKADVHNGKPYSPDTIDEMIIPYGRIVLFVGIALAAAFMMTVIPARRASRVPIAEALRYE